jgi:hypothetical protein
MASHIDLRTFVVTIDPRVWDPDQRDLGIVEGTVNPIEKVPPGAEGIETRQRRALWTHEIVHFWQCLWLPYLYLHATYAWHSISEQSLTLQERRQPFDWRIEPLPPIDDVWDGISKDRSYRNKAGKVSPPLSPWRMMENAASLFQYEVFAGIDKNPSPEDYEEWAIDNPAYLDVYDFLVDLLGQDIAFQLMPSLIAAAFHTTAPVRTFLRLAGTMSTSTARRLSREWRGNARAILINTLAQEHSRLSFGPEFEYDPSMVYLLPQGRFDERIQHPILASYRRLWFEDVAVSPELAGLFLEFPKGIYTYQVERWRRLIRRFRPPVIIILNSDTATSETMTSTLLVRPGPLSQAQVRDLLEHHASLRAFDILRGAAVTKHPVCKCTNCRFWATGLCQGVLDPPAPGPTPEERCWFPSVLARHGAKMCSPYRLVVE